MPPGDRPLFTVESLAAFLDLSERSARALLAGPDPEIPSFKIGNLRRVRPEDVDAYIKRRLAA